MEFDESIYSVISIKFSATDSLIKQDQLFESGVRTMGFLSYFVDNYTASLYDMIVEYVDTEYSLWLTWFLTPVIVTFLLPAVIILLIYASSIIFHLYRLYRMRVVDGVPYDWRQAARLAVCALWDAHGWLWHGYEIRGLENIPDGPFLVIYYHGALPIDMYYFIAKMLLFKRRHIHTVADRFLFKIPGWSTLLEGLCVIPGTVQTCAGVLRAGNPLAISPGGVYEAQFGDHYYRLNWKARIGFAKVAQEAKVPIVPMFTQNLREAFRTVGWLRGVCLRIYAATRIPLAPVYGGFPVKLITHLGKPIPYDATLSPEQLQQKVASAIEDLVDEHQRVPGSILLALMERIHEMPKRKRKVDEDKPIANGKCHSEKLPAKSENGPAKSENGPAKSENGPAKSENGPAKSENGPLKSENGPAKSENGPLKSENGPAKSENGPAKSENGPAKSENGPAIKANGPASDKIVTAVSDKTVSATTAINKSVAANVEKTVDTNTIATAISDSILCDTAPGISDRVNSDNTISGKIKVS